MDTSPYPQIVLLARARLIDLTLKGSEQTPTLKQLGEIGDLKVFCTVSFQTVGKRLNVFLYKKGNPTDGVERKISPFRQDEY